MNLNFLPRLPKWIFLAIDGGLLLTAFLIASFFDTDKPLYFTAMILLVVLAAFIALIPFLADFAADHAEAAQQERERAAEQIARLEAAAENLARAAAQIKAVEESVHKAAREAESLPYRMQEKLAEFNEALAEQENGQREALEQELTELRAAHTAQLKTAAEKIAQTVTELTALEKGARAQAADAGAAAEKLDTALRAALTQLDEKIAGLGKAAAEKPVRRAKAEAASEPAAAAAEPAAAVHDRREESTPAADGGHEPPPPETAGPPPASVEASPAGSVPATEATAEAAPEPPKPKKPRAPRKPKPEDIMAAMSEEPAPAPTGDEPAPEGAAPSDSSSDTSAPVESSASSDGATRLLATAYIGIGNKLFIRGDGPGLNWDTGVPMQFVSIGKWGWFTHESTGPVRIKLYKNDETAALSGGITLEPGKHTEVTAQF